MNPLAAWLLPLRDLKLIGPRLAGLQMTCCRLCTQTGGREHDPTCGMPPSARAAVCTHARGKPGEAQGSWRGARSIVVSATHCLLSGRLRRASHCAKQFRRSSNHFPNRAVPRRETSSGVVECLIPSSAPFACRTFSCTRHHRLLRAHAGQGLQDVLPHVRNQRRGQARRGVHRADDTPHCGDQALPSGRRDQPLRSERSDRTRLTLRIWA